MNTTGTNAPRLNAQRASHQRSQLAKKCGVVYTASEVQQMPYGSPIRAAYTLAGDRGVRAYLALQA